MDLELATTTDLIKELFSRDTFVGVLIFSPENHKVKYQKHEFDLASTTDPHTSIKILQTAIASLESQIEN